MSVTALGKIIIADSDENISSLLSVNLRSEGYEVDVINDALNVKDKDLSGIKLIIGDVMGDEYAGISLLRDIKNNPMTAHVGFIICSIVDRERAIIGALDAGADDYIVKPFSLRELIARANAVIRRHARYSMPARGTSIKFHSLTLDLLTGRVTDGDTVLKLTKTEYVILELLLKNVNNYVSRAEIYRHVWKDDIEKNNDRIVDTNISRLRKKIGDLASHLVNRSGLGYMMKL